MVRVIRQGITNYWKLVTLGTRPDKWCVAARRLPQSTLFLIFFSVDAGCYGDLKPPTALGVILERRWVAVSVPKSRRFTPVRDGAPSLEDHPGLSWGAKQS